MSAADPITPPPALHIAAVARDTGIAQDTLRVWERRYGFPQPLRDANGERSYPPEQLEQLRLISRLLAAGHRPGRVVPLPLEQLHALTSQIAAGAAEIKMLELLRRHDAAELLRTLTQEQMRLGLARFVTELVAPMVTEVGAAWVRGELQVFEEHLFSETLTRVLRAAIATLPLQQAQAAPRALLTTIADEPHGLGLLMVEALLALEGCACVSLGVQTPLEDIAIAAQRHRVDLVVLSFSGLPGRRQVLDALTQLRDTLGPGIGLWAGGSSSALARAPAGVQVIRELGQLAPAVAAWRHQRGSSS